MRTAEGPGFDDANCLVAKTAQSSALKTLFETLKDLLEDVALEFDREGVRLIATDNTSIAMVHVRLDATKFDEYHCPSPLTVGVNMPCLHKLVRSIGNSDTIAFFMASPDASELGIHVENHERRTSTNFKISVMDIPSSTIEVPPVAFDSCVVLPSGDMQKIVRDMAAISDRVEVTNSHNRLAFLCKGDFCSQETVLEESNKLQTTMEEDGVIIQGVFSLKYLALFCKCSSLCASLKLNLKNDYPIVFNYSIACLGDLKLCLSPMCDEDA